MNKVLLVDDDPNVLNAYQRRLRKRFEIETALCSEEGVTAVNFLGPFAVIVSDMQMPRENGAEFLAKIQKSSPDSVRIMLTGNADQQTAIDAVNQGGVFCFLNKPCQAEELEVAIQRGIAEHQRISQLRNSCKENVHALIETLSSVCHAFKPKISTRQSRLKCSMSEFSTLGSLSNAEAYQTAAIVSQLGSYEIHDDLFAKVARCETLSSQESKQWNDQYRLAVQMIEKVPHLDFETKVLRLLSGEKLDEIDGWTKEIHLASELLQAAIQFDLSSHEANLETLEILDDLKANENFSDKALVLIEKWVAQRDQRRLVEVDVDALVDGMKLVEEIATTSGTVLVPKGIEVCPSLRAKLQKHVVNRQVQATVKALLPINQVVTQPSELQAC